MKKKNIGIFLAAFIFLGVQSSQAALKVGEPAPDFNLMDTSNEQRSLSDYRDQFVVLEWLNHDCPFVRKHYGSGNMQQLQKTYTGKDVVWLSISSSAPGKQGYYPADEAGQLTQEKGASPTAVLLDSDGDVGRLYGAKTTPHIFIIDPQGTLIYQGAIDDIASANPADIPNAQNYVQLTLEAAMTGKAVSVSATKSYGCSVKY
jgi:peroxiredoxin